MAEKTKIEWAATRQVPSNHRMAERRRLLDGVEYNEFPEVRP